MRVRGIQRFLVRPVLIAIGVAGCGQSDDGDKSGSATARPVKTIVAEPASASLHRVYPASVLPSRQVALSFRVSGRIVELPVRAAMRVEEGDVIARLDPRDFEAEVERLQSRMEQATAQLDAMSSGARAEDRASMEAAIKAAEAQFKAARLNEERVRQLFDDGIVARVELDDAVTNLEVATAELEAKKQELIKGEAGSRAEEVEAQEATIRELQSQLATAKDSLSDATLLAPFDGIIAKREVDNFANVQAKETVAVLQELRMLDLVFDIPGPDVLEFSRREDVVTIATMDGIPNREFPATLVEFSTEADPATQTYQCRVSIEKPEDVVVLPGMTGRIVVRKREENRQVFLVPSTALAAEADGKAFIWIVSEPDNQVSKRSVKTGEVSGEDVIVLQGVNSGDRVVTAGVSYLQPGMTVRPIATVGE